MCVYELRLTPMLYAIDTDDESMLSLLLEHGVDVNDECGGQRALLVDQKFRWPLLDVLDGLRPLRGADTNVRMDESRLTPLLYATYTGDQSMVYLLLGHGADVNHDCGGKQALHLATSLILRARRAAAEPRRQGGLT